MPMPQQAATIDEQQDWPEEPEALPPRPRRRLLARGGSPAFMALASVLLIACGFIAGVLVEKGQTSAGGSAGAATSVASRFAALRGTPGTGARSATAATGAKGAAGGAGVRPTTGTVAYLSGKTLYVTDVEGNTIKVSSSQATSVTKTVKATVAGIHPGEEVTITGATAANGAVKAEAISVGAAAGGLGSLFGGARGASGSSKATGAGEPSLFGGG